MLSTKEAAEKLGVSSRRVTKLISEGRIAAEKHSGVWLVDPMSVEAYASVVTPKKGGRPPKGSGKSEHLYTLMNRQYPVASLVYNSDLGVFVGVKESFDLSRLPLGALENGRMSLLFLNSWWRNRGLSEGRPDLAKLLACRGISVPEELLIRSLGLSLSDQYWLCPGGENLDWHEVNFFENDFSSAAYVDSEPCGYAHPDNTSDGNLPKHWVIEDGTRMLLKGGGVLNQEPYNEVVATALHGALLKEGSFVSYGLAQWNGAVASKCANFVSSDEELIPAYYVLRAFEKSAHLSDYQHYLAVCEKLGVQGAKMALEEMIVCDNILANSDRHWRNFGLVRNVETLEFRMAPLFDSGNCLWSHMSEAEFRRGNLSFVSKPFHENPGKQLNLVDDFSWISVEALRSFELVALEILSQNPALASRMLLLAEGLGSRINRIAGIVAAFA